MYRYILPVRIINTKLPDSDNINLSYTAQVRISNTEWPAYLDIMEACKTKWTVVPCHKGNGFHPTNAEYYDRTNLNAKTCLFPIISNPGNPTGHARAGAELKELIEMAESEKYRIMFRNFHRHIIYY